MIRKLFNYLRTSPITQTQKAAANIFTPDEKRAWAIDQLQRALIEKRYYPHNQFPREVILNNVIFNLCVPCASSEAGERIFSHLPHTLRNFSISKFRIPKSPIPKSPYLFTNERRASRGAEKERKLVNKYEGIWDVVK